MNNDLVSIITPVYKSEKFISQTIDSVLNQVFENWEMLIVDDASPDGSNEIINKYINKDKRIRLIKLDKNSGPAVARNRAIQEAEGRYIAFLDSDDIWHREKLAKQLVFMQDSEIALSFTGYHRLKEGSGEIIDYVSTPNRVDYHELLKKNIIGCLTAMYDTQKLGKVYMPEIRKRQDFGLWLEILKRIPYAYGLNESLAHYRVRINSVSSNKIVASKYNWKLYREVEKLPLYKAIYYFGWYTYRSFFKSNK